LRQSRPHLSAFQSRFDLFAAGANLAKDTVVIDGCGAGNGLSNQPLAEIVDDTSNWVMLMESSLGDRDGHEVAFLLLSQASSTVPR
jgi:hypothetical protein